MNPLRLAVLAACAGASVGCSQGDAARPADEPSVDRAARARATIWLRTARFEDADRATDCQPDCREQERGFNYARAGRVELPGDCDLARVRSHASEDFIEGCRAYGQYLEAASRGR